MKVLIPILLVAGIIVVAIGLYIRHLRKTLRGSEDPLIFLSGKERRAYARELLQREKERYEAERQERLNQMIWNPGAQDT